ncbi:YpmS family protein [Bacillus massiliglaciei]|uniref:YpmS family protein n=1 Tax=Bacillus massiliglaciei TaxID=1816693 RepID=UPI000B26C19D|nr:YpmS family protein [Bacillus massiliglaciei]
MTGVRWKTLFFSLLALNLIVIATLVLLINLPVKDKEIPKSISKEEDIQFQVHTNREDLNRLINQYLDKEGLTGGVHYEVYLADEVELYGEIPFFNRQLEMKLTFEPFAQKNGDILLKQKSISVGQMELPVSYVMNFINKRYKMPEWVTIRPNDQSIYVSLQNMELKSDVRVKANNFDLKNDDISFLLTVPSWQP